MLKYYYYGIKAETEDAVSIIESHYEGVVVAKNPKQAEKLIRAVIERMARDYIIEIEWLVRIPKRSCVINCSNVGSYIIMKNQGEQDVTAILN
jgi:adenosine deaminase